MSKKIGIALGGGGAKGFAHIGILEVLSENGIECEVVTGTSIGSLVGAAYAANALSELVETSSKIKLTDIPLLLGPTVSKTGLFSGKSVQEMLGNIVQYENIEELPRKFAAVSADIASEELVVFLSGSIRDAVRASISIPALFTPVVKNSQMLVDGGLLEPLPIEMCRELGARTVLAVDLFGNQSPTPSTEANDPSFWPSGLSNTLSYLETISNKLKLAALFASDDDSKLKNGTPTNIIEIVEATLSTSQRLLTKARLQAFPADVLLQPAVKDVGFLDFHRGKSTIEVGRQCALESIDRILEVVNS